MSKKSRKPRCTPNEAICTYVNSKGLGLFKPNVSIYEVACEALEIDGIPCPADRDFKGWVYKHIMFVYAQAAKKNKKFKILIEAKITTDKNYTREQFNRVVRNRLGSNGASSAHDVASGRVQVLVAGVDAASDAFLSTYEWRSLRMQALKLHGARCQCCGASPATGAVMNVDHIKPRKLFPELALELSNLQILCHECNHGKGNWDQTDWRAAA